MRIPLLTLAIALAAACTAERPADDPTTGAATPDVAATPPAPDSSAPAPTPPPPVDTPPPDTGDTHTVPARFQGRYATDARACADASHASRLTIESSRIAFHEASGPVTRVTQGPTEVSITAKLTGEGETREAQYSFRLSADGSTLTDVGNGAARQRCN